MLKSNICVLKQYSHLSAQLLGECSADPGGYFIINGSEKVLHRMVTLKEMVAR